MSTTSTDHGDLGRFRLHEEIGSGSTGTVNRGLLLEDAWGAQKGTEIAVKFLHQSLTGHPGARARFLQEARAGLDVEHPNLVHILAIGDEELLGQRILFLVMEYVPGPTLREWRRAAATGNEPLVREVGAQIAAALGALHQRGVVHLDVKPENVILSHGDRAVLMDLGFARKLGVPDAEGEIPPGSPSLPSPRSSSGSPTDVAGGSIAYAAPETLRGELPTPLCDLYSLGVLLFELMSGRLPLGEGTPEEVLAHKLQDDAPLLGESDSEVSPFLEMVVATLLSRDPKERFSSASELEEVLRRGERSTWWSGRAATARLPRTRRRSALPLIGRREEIHELRSKFEHAARSGLSGLVTVESESYMGKRRLILELENQLAQREVPDLRILEGRCPPRGDGVPYGGFVSALERFLGLRRGQRPGPGEIAQLGRFCDPESARLLGSLLLGSSEPEPGPTIPRAFFNFLEGLAAQGPLLFVLEDLHEITGSGLGVLELLLDEGSDLPILLIGILRPSRTPANERLAALIARLERRERIRRIHLHPLDVEDIVTFAEEILAEDIDVEPFARELHERTGGIPGFVAESLQSLLRDGTLEWRHGRLHPRRDITSVPVPASMNASVLQRREELAPELRAELDAACVAGMRFDPRLLANAFGGSSLEHTEHLGRIELGRDLVRPEGASYRFASASVRKILYTNLDPQYRRDAHERLASAIEERMGREGPTLRARIEIAQHLSRAGQDQRAVSLLSELAAELLQDGMVSRAADLAARALDHLEAMPEDRENDQLRLEMLLLDAEASGRRGHLGRARVRADHAYRLAVTQMDSAGRLRALVLLGKQAHRAGNNRLALDYLEQARVIAEAGSDPDALASVLVPIGTALGYLGRNHDAREVLEQAHDLTSTRPSPIAVDVLVAVGRNLEDRDRAAEAFPILQEALERLEGTQRSLARVQTRLHLARALSELGRYEAALDQIDQGLEEERATSDRQVRANLASLRGDILVKVDRFEEAFEALDEARLLAEEIGDRYTVVYTWIHLAHAYVSRRNPKCHPPRALACARRAVRLADDLDAGRLRASARSARARVLLRQGNLELARASSEKAMQILRTSTRDARRQIAIFYTHYAILERMGDDRAEHYLKRAERLVRARSTRVPEGEGREIFLHEERLHRKVLRAREARSRQEV